MKISATTARVASGTPVLAFDCAAATEVIEDSKNGWLVQGEDAQRYVLKALEITQKKATLHAAKSHAAESIRPWDWQEIVTQVEVIFRHSLATGSKV